MRDTREQRIALSTDRHLSVTANAGSGKTRVLVNRYLKIIDLLKGNRDFHPRQLAAITFTRKAASEMMAKIVAKIEEMTLNTVERSELASLRNIREALSTAKISTIHSFCSSLLREFPIEADVNPNFSEISETDITRITKDAVITAMDEWLDDSDSEKKQRAESLFNFLNLKNVEIILVRLMSNRYILPGLIQFYDRTDDEIYNAFQELYINHRCGIMLRSFELIPRIIELIDPENLTPQTKKEYLNKLLPKLQYAVEISGTLSEDTLKQNFIEYDNLISEIGTLISDKNKIRDKYLHNMELDYITEITSYSSLFSANDDEKNIFNNYEYEILTYEHNRTLLEIAADAAFYIEQEKEELGGLDFDDLLHRTNSLLDNEEVCKKIRRKIKYLLVDEFQDTDPIQYEILTKLIPDLVCPDISNSINLFLVGDAKQSIYGFRNADVRVFEKARQDIAKSNSAKITSGVLGQDLCSGSDKIVAADMEESLGNLKLTSTFRLLPVIAAFVNTVCRKIMSEKTSSYDVDYQELVCARKYETIGTEQFSGSAELLLCLKNSENEEEDSCSESVLAANYISAITNSPDHLIYDKNTQQPRMINYSDIAVLSSSRSKFAELTECFINDGIPYLVHSGSGFFKAQEIIDIISYINFLYDPNNDIALLGILKSPFFNITDTEIMHIAANRGKKTVWQALEDYVQEPENTVSKIKRAHSIISHHMLLSTKLLISQLIINILDTTAWYGVITLQHSSHQSEANMEKFLQYARDFENRGFKSFSDFVDEINYLMNSDDKESEAVFISNLNAVNIMTIHSSKGLEFPVVILFNSNALPASNQKKIPISTEYGINYANNTVIDNHPQENKSIGYILGEKEAVYKESAEKKRLLYVALTRAEQKIVISASAKLAKNNTTFSPKGLFKLVLSGIGITPEMLIDCQEKFTLSDSLGILNSNYQTETRDVSFEISIHKDIEKIKKDQEISNALVDSRLFFLLDNITAAPADRFFSPSSLLLMQSSKQEYIRKYVLGLKEEHSGAAAAHNNRVITGAEYGTLLHMLMEHLPFWYSPESGPDELRMKELLTPYKLPEAIGLKLLSEASSATSTNLINRSFRNICQSIAELPFLLPVDRDFLQGFIDLLLINDTGEAEVWDWKSNITDTSDKARLVEHYKHQMMAYVYVVSKIYPVQNIYRARLLFTKLASSTADDNDWTHLFEWTKSEVEEYEQSLFELLEQSTM